MTVVINGTTGIDTGTGSLIAADSTTATYLDMFEDTDNGSNYVRLIAPTSIASNRTITLPDATGTAVVGSSAVSAIGQIPFSTDGSTYTPTAKIVSGTSVSASGTSVDFTGIPSWVKRVTVMLSGVSTSGTSPIIIRIGDSGGISATGYTTGYAEAINVSNTAAANPTTGFQLHTVNASTRETEAGVTITNVNSNLWLAFGVSTFSDYPSGTVVSGSKSLSSTLTQVRITTVGGANTFDAGSINILYE
jgi:hypothetical protein